MAPVPHFAPEHGSVSFRTGTVPVDRSGRVGGSEQRQGSVLAVAPNPGWRFCTASRTVGYTIHVPRRQRGRIDVIDAAQRSDVVVTVDHEQRHGPIRPGHRFGSSHPGAFGSPYQPAWYADRVDRWRQIVAAQVVGSRRSGRVSGNS